MKTNEQHTEAAAELQPHISNRLLTVPNLICVIRLIGSFVLIPIAWQDQNEVFLWLFLFLAITDWVDGKLAILLNQRSVFGARLDSWADAALYAALLFGLVTMYGETLRPELVWITAALISLFSEWSLWPLRIAGGAVIITNLEALLITIISPTWRADVTSIYHAWRDRSGS